MNDSADTGHDGGKPLPDASRIPSAWQYRRVRKTEQPSRRVSKLPSITTNHLAAAVALFFVAVAGFYAVQYFIAVRGSSLVLEADVETVDALWWSADGKTIAVWSLRPGTPATGPVLQTWDAVEGVLLRSFPVLGEFIEAAALAPTGDRLALALPDSNDVTTRMLVVHHARIPDPARSTRLQHATVARMTFSTSGRYLAIACEQMLVWDIESRTVKDSLALPEILYQFEMIFSGPDQPLAAGVVRDSAFLWNVADGSRVHLPAGSVSNAPRIAFSESGSRVVVASGDSVFIFSTHDGKLLVRTATPREYNGTVLVAHEAKRLAVLSPQGSVILLDPFTSRVVARQAPEGGTPLEARFSPDGRLLGVLDSDGGFVSCIDAFSGKEIFRAVHRESLWEKSDRQIRFSFSPDGRTLATACSKIRLWPLP